MNLPNCEWATVAREKLTEYLLSTSHRRGRRKAAFFVRFGFSSDAWEVLADALRVHGCAHEVVEVTPTEFGTMYRVEGEIASPDGRQPRVRTIWMIDTGSDRPRFITAYPLGRATQ